MADRYVCQRCGKPGIPDEVTVFDPRFTTGRCTGDHVEKQVLILESFNPTEKKSKKKT